MDSKLGTAYVRTVWGKFLPRAATELIAKADFAMVSIVDLRLPSDTFNRHMHNLRLMDAIMKYSVPLLVCH